MIKNSHINNGIRYVELDHIGYPRYCVGEDGSLWSWKCKGGTKDKYRWVQVHGWKTKGEYILIRLHKFSNSKNICKAIHRLILEIFRGPCPFGMEACHNDNNPQNNHISNLRWDTPKNNCKDRTENGKHIVLTPKGSKHGMSKLTEKNVLEIRTSNLSRKKLSEKFCVSYKNICDIINRKIWRHI